MIELQQLSAMNKSLSKEIYKDYYFKTLAVYIHKNELKLCCYGQLVDIAIKTPNKNQ